MPSKSDSPKPAAPKTKRRVRKTSAGETAKPAAKRRAPARSTAAKKAAEAVAKTPPAPLLAAPLPAPAKPSPAAREAAEKPMTVILNGILTPILPVSPREPASAETRSEMRSAAPAPRIEKTLARTPLAATVAFLAMLGALMLGYWTGFNVANGSVSDPAVTVAEASEVTPAPISPAPIAPVLEDLDAAEPEQMEMDARDLEPRRETGLHLQVSALKSPSAASQLQHELESRGFPVRVDPASKDSLVRVYVGPIADKAELRGLTSALRKEGLKPFPKRL